MKAAANVWLWVLIQASFITINGAFAPPSSSRKRYDCIATTPTKTFNSSRSKSTSTRNAKHSTTSSIQSSSSDNNNNNNDMQQPPQVQPPRPNSCTYWASDHLLAGEYPTDSRGGEEATRQKLRAYLQAGICVFIDLTQEHEKLPYEELVRQEAARLGMDATTIQHIRRPIPDFGVPTKRSVMKQILDDIDQAEKQQQKVYVHCRGGIGRTGTTVGCYLVRHYGMTGPEALAEVNRLFQSSDRSMESYASPETRDQMAFVRQWGEDGTI